MKVGPVKHQDAFKETMELLAAFESLEIKGLDTILVLRNPNDLSCIFNRLLINLAAVVSFLLGNTGPSAGGMISFARWFYPSRPQITRGLTHTQAA
jgi:hypothetical protein